MFVSVNYLVYVYVKEINSSLFQINVLFIYSPHDTQTYVPTHH